LTQLNRIGQVAVVNCEIAEIYKVTLGGEFASSLVAQSGCTLPFAEVFEIPDAIVTLWEIWWAPLDSRRRHSR
jgi:hypothetical protein